MLVQGGQRQTEWYEVEWRACFNNNLGYVTVREKVCMSDVELLAVELRSYYLPREFSTPTVVIVYSPPLAAGDVIHFTDLLTYSTQTFSS